MINLDEGEARMKDADFVIDEIVAAQDADPFDDEATTDALTDALNLIVEQRKQIVELQKQIGILERMIAQMPKPVKLLDVFGDNYEKIVRCKDCTRRDHCELVDGFGKSADWFCADGDRR